MFHAQFNGIQNLFGYAANMGIQYALQRRRTEINNPTKIFLNEQRLGRNAQASHGHIGCAVGNEDPAADLEIQIVQILQQRILPVELNIVQNLRQQLLSNLPRERCNTFLQRISLWRGNIVHEYRQFLLRCRPYLWKCTRRTRGIRHIEYIAYGFSVRLQEAYAMASAPDPAV